MIVGIPTIGSRMDLLLPLVEQVHSFGHELLLLSNGPYPVLSRLGEAQCPIEWCPGAGIYGMWNLILQRARDQGTFAAVLNDDIEISASDLDRAQDVLEHPGVGVVGWDPDPPHRVVENVRVHGSYRHGGITGFCFAIKPIHNIHFDEESSWWGGDDDIVQQYLANDFDAIKMRGARVIHHASSSASLNPGVYLRVEQDRQRLLDKWGETW